MSVESFIATNESLLLLESLCDHTADVSRDLFLFLIDELGLGLIQFSVMPDSFHHNATRQQKLSFPILLPMKPLSAVSDLQLLVVILTFSTKFIVPDLASIDITVFESDLALP